VFSDYKFVEITVNWTAQQYFGMTEKAQL